jgi:subfamily B ATP-binding cassette protein MsbA
MPGTAPGGLALYRRLLGYAGPYWKQFAAAVIAMALFAMTDTGFAALMKPMLDGSFVERDPDTIRLVPLALLALFLFRGVSGFISRYGLVWIGRHVIQALRRELFQRMLYLPCTYYDAAPGGRLLSRLTFDVEQVAEASANAVMILIRDSLTMLFLLAYMLWVSPWLTLMFLLVGPSIALIVRYASRRFRRISRHIQDSMGELTQFVDESLTGHEVIKAFDAQPDQLRRFEIVNDTNRRLHLRMALVDALGTPVVQFVAAAILALVVFLATQKSMLDQVSVGGFMSFIAATLLLMQPMKRLTNINASIQRGLAAANSIFSLLDESPEVDRGTRPLERAHGEIRFEQVGFRYAGQNAPALEAIDLRVGAGQKVALVGRSGSGKTTLTKLLMRFYTPTAGVIQVDGVDIHDYRLEDFRRQFALVSQDVTLFNTTVADNIAFGCGAPVSREAIEAAAEAAHALAFIRALPQGFDTRIGDRGGLLSGGQRQRLAIARAILKDAPILVLDEATSALDAESERHIQAALETLLANRTALIIAHRLSTVKRADLICLLRDGHIVERGTHRSLMETGGDYAHLYRDTLDPDG